MSRDILNVKELALRGDLITYNLKINRQLLLQEADGYYLPMALALIAREYGPV